MIIDKEELNNLEMPEITTAKRRRTHVIDEQLFGEIDKEEVSVLPSTLHDESQYKVRRKSNTYMAKEN